MAVSITFNSDLLSAFQTFYIAKQVDLVESLAWLINDEKSFGISEEQGNMIVHLAHFYFEAIEILRQSYNPDWTYLDWLTEDEYNAIMYKRQVLEY
jgi:hypothetical protein